MEKRIPRKKTKIANSCLVSDDNSEGQQEEVKPPAAATCNINTVGTKSILANILSPQSGEYTISITPLMLQEWKGDESYNAGCVLRIHATDPEDVQVGIHDMIHARISSATTTGSSSIDQVSAAVNHLIEYQTDAFEDVLAVGDRLAASPSLLVGRDEAEWFSNPLLLPFSLIRRLAAPMYLVAEMNSNKLVRSNTSLLESIFLKSMFRDTVGRAIYARIKEVESIIKDRRRKNTKLCPSDKHNVKCLKSLRETLIAILERTNSIKVLPRINVDPASLPKRAEGPPSQFLPPEGPTEETLAVRVERRRITTDLKRRLQSGNKDTPLLALGTNVEFQKTDDLGTFLLTSNELSSDEFYHQRDIMELVNSTLHPPYTAGYSMPKLQKAKISDGALQQLKAIFFDKDGSLNSKLLGDIDCTDRNGYINFANEQSSSTRADKRWQVPLKRHSKRRRVGSRARIEKLLSSEKLVDLKVEAIHDLGMLIGGTQDQSIHHDIPRQSITWASEDENSEELPITGWEFDRAGYNYAMANPDAPRSILLAMNESKTARIGVQKDQVKRCRSRKDFCSIVDGVRGEEFKITRDNKLLVELEANPGVVFTGDFPHAGVRSAPVGSQEDKSMKLLFDQLEEIIANSLGLGHAEFVKKVFKMMCSFPDLDKLCRFHCSTEPLHSPLQFPRNTVGFVGCYPNDPGTGADDKEICDCNVI